jgi:hypothetical protein
VIATLISKTARFATVSFALVVFPLFAEQLFAQDLTITIVENGEMETVYLNATAMRYVTSSDDVIIRIDQRKFIMVDNDAKTYSEMSFDRLEQMKAKMNKELDPKDAEGLKKTLGWDAKETKVTRVGTGDTILGYKTEKYLLTGPAGQLEVHVAPSIQVPAAYHEAMKLSGGMGPFSAFAESFKEIKGAVLKQVSSLKMFGRVDTTTSVASKVDLSPIPAARFAPPSGYKNVPPGF